ncbi:MAG: hypothetical protein H7Y14_02830 [Burkholderiales bacterium]|nr:hypothetical protein [Burkholderiales bacterium]
MQPIALYCCSYARDAVRAQRMVESVARHNRDGIALYVSAPRADVELFRQKLGSQAQVLCEEGILAANPATDVARVNALRGLLRQQIVKSEFWRLGICENTIVLDSDCKFVRDFTRADFLAEPGVPYSVIHEGKDLLQFAEVHGPQRVRSEFLQDRLPIMGEMGRDGVVYDYGYAPYLWSRRVWSDLAEKHLAPRGETLADAIVRHQSELTWYGEALLRFRSIPIHPRGPFFRMYHYEHQYWTDVKLGVTEETIARDYLGVVYQSNWETWTEFGTPTKRWPSRVARSVKREVRRLLHSARMP